LIYPRGDVEYKSTDYKYHPMAMRELGK